MKTTLWTKNFTLVTVATIMGAAGAIASNFALSFLVFDETGSTLAAAFIIAIQLVPNFLIPLWLSPWMDRMPRKPFLVAGDTINGVLYAFAGFYLLNFEFSYISYMAFSLLLAALGAFDSLAYNSLFPKLIPKGCEQKGYTIGGMVYPTMMVIMMPIAAIMYEQVGVAVILLMQAALSLLAALVESRIVIREEKRLDGERFSFQLWKADMLDTMHYLHEEKGIRSIYAYMAVSNGVGNAYSPILMAFFRTTPGFTLAMYAAFSVAEFAGRSLGGLVHYHLEIPKRKRFSFAFVIYQLYEGMDMLLLWLPYPLMLVNRAICGFLGINSATMRQAAVQSYIPETLRSKLNAFESVLISAACCVASVVVGAMGEIMDYRLCLTVCAAFACACCWCTIWRQRKAVRRFYNAETEEERAVQG
ncbi:MAG: MFS transporter [Clostridia bacterium]